TNPANPVGISSHFVSPGAQSVAVSGNRVCTANYGGGLCIYDISNPTNLAFIACTGTNNNGRAMDVTMSGNYVYLAKDNEGLRVYDISDASNPVNVGTLRTAGPAYGVTVSDHYAYLSCPNLGFYI